MSDCYCDYDMPSVYRARTVKARKLYRCEECSGPIVPGEAHEYAFGVYDGDAFTFRTCERCTDLRQFVKNSVPCFCWAHGNTLQDALEAIEAAYDRARKEVRGLFMGYGRLRIAIKRHNAAARSLL